MASELTWQVKGSTDQEGLIAGGDIVGGLSQRPDKGLHRPQTGAKRQGKRGRMAMKHVTADCGLGVSHGRG